MQGVVVSRKYVLDLFYGCGDLIGYWTTLQCCDWLISKNLSRLFLLFYSVSPTDLHIYNLDAVPPIYVVSNHVDITSLPLQMADPLRRVQPVAVANHVKARRHRSSVL